jgi:hypothetical protein
MWEMQEGYKHKEGQELPVDDANHGCDAIRYGVCGRYPIRSEMGGGSEVPTGAGDANRIARLNVASHPSPRTRDAERRSGIGRA